MRRFLRFLGLAGPEAGVAGPQVWPLCRLRHATLHPGATLWSPGALGGSLGAGADAALLGAGDGGVVVVAFETPGRAGLHPTGVLAQVSAWPPGVAAPVPAAPSGLAAPVPAAPSGLAAPVPAAPSGLAAPVPTAPVPAALAGLSAGSGPPGFARMPRLRLEGLRRVTLGAETVSAVPLPSVATWPLPDHLEDRRAPPTSLVETLTRLAALDVPWAPHWRESFALSAEDGLGQWATTLGWRLSPEERLQLFDAPGRIAAVLEDNLAGMLAGLLGTD